jgi:hypothetical protein
MNSADYFPFFFPSLEFSELTSDCGRLEETYASHSQSHDLTGLRQLRSQSAHHWKRLCLLLLLEFLANLCARAETHFRLSHLNQEQPRIELKTAGFHHILHSNRFEFLVPLPLRPSVDTLEEISEKWRLKKTHEFEYRSKEFTKE